MGSAFSDMFAEFEELDWKSRLSDQQEDGMRRELSYLKWDEKQTYIEFHEPVVCYRSGFSAEPQREREVCQIRLRSPAKKRG